MGHPFINEIAVDGTVLPVRIAVYLGVTLGQGMIHITKYQMKEVV